MKTLTIRRPDDWHLHLRDDAMLAAVLPASAAVFGRAIVMPNLVPPLVSVAQIAAYRARILAALPAGSRFQPLMTAYLSQATDPADLTAGHRDGIVTAVKLYPAGATTNSAAGVADLATLRPVLEAMQRAGIPLLVHGEVTDPAVDIFDREARFVDSVLAPLLRDFPELRVVMEHLTSAVAAQFIADHPASAAGRLAATVTPQHLWLDRNALLVGGLRPHYYCLPVLKTAADRIALRRAAAGGAPWLFLGTDSAPHGRRAKESACCAAGAFTAPTALPLYAQVFDEEGALDKLEAFASLNGPHFYGLEPNGDTVTLEALPAPEPQPLALADGDVLVPFVPPVALTWRLRI